MAAREPEEGREATIFHGLLASLPPLIRGLGCKSCLAGHQEGASPDERKQHEGRGACCRKSSHFAQN